MKKIGLFIFIVALLLGIFAGSLFSFGKVRADVLGSSIFSYVEGSGNLVVQKRDLASFNGIEVGGVFQVEIVSQKEQAVEVEADDNLIDQISTEVKDGILIIKNEKRFSWGSKPKVRISVPDIKAIRTSGSSYVTASNINSASLDLKASGSSKIVVFGSSENIDVRTSGSSKVDAKDLRSVKTTVRSSGASKADVVAEKHLLAKASGAGKISYSGEPEVLEKNTSGAGRINQR